ncbi:PREDICTED: pentatricopeptide repeat-containing protein At1g02150-like isoform X1 [Lupinus angustifolius]|nr:PREDICTED: pentatricopeptide repeat-containing protein At1g02150-like isoform X1 [Lupinus angustifolius]
MIVQLSLNLNIHQNNFSYSLPLRRFHTLSLSNHNNNRPISHSWKEVCRRISSYNVPYLISDATTVLDQWEVEGNTLTKWELGQILRDMRKRNKHHPALQVCNWMNNREERFGLSASDAAVQIDLISKVHGVASAEEYFRRLKNVLKDRKTYCSLLNVYAHSRLKEKAESLFVAMRSKGYAINSLPFNVMMTMYLNLKEYDKVDTLVSEMIEANVKLDLYSYNIWLSSCGSQGLAEKMEQTYELLTKDRTIVPNWTTFSTLAKSYTKMGHFEKAEEYIRKVETTIEGRNRIPFHYLLTLYGNIGKKEEVYRVWKIYKLIFRRVTNLGYLAFMSSLVRLGDIEGAENLYEEWLSVKSSYDSRIGDHLLGWYAKKGDTDKALGIFKQMAKSGQNLYSSTWEILSEVHISNQRISEALSCLKEAFMAGAPKTWRPNPVKVSAFFELCRKQDDKGSAETLIGLLRQSGFLEDEVYASLIGLSDGAIGKGGLSIKIDTVDRTENIYEDENTEVMFNQLEGSF